MNPVSRLHRDKYCSPVRLRKAKLCGIEEFECTDVPQLHQTTQNMGSVVVEARIKKAADILNHHSLRVCFRNQPDGFREQVALVIFAKLFACN